VTDGVPGNKQLPSRRLVLVGGAFVLAGCGGSPKPKVSPIHVQIIADPSINPNADDAPSPTVVRVYELKSDTKFRQADFFALFDNDATTLGADLVGKREFEIKPGQTETYQRDVPIEAEYIGVIAGFRDITSAQWRAVVKIKKEDINDIIINVSSLSVNITLAKTRSPGWI
jgi:type VI secretion system protein VasD